MEPLSLGYCGPIIVLDMVQDKGEFTLYLIKSRTSEKMYTTSEIPKDFQLEYYAYREFIIDNKYLLYHKQFENIPIPLIGKVDLMKAPNELYTKIVPLQSQ